MPGHARAVKFRNEGWVNFVYRTLAGTIRCSGLSIWLPIELELFLMKRLTEWINLIAAVIRLISVISRTGWF
ncbi:hypothetical protein [Pseudomonas sp. D1HM]|uniref:hypothetical protein n=1 Tax=Pseudomonas sp. D1HM TaxID=1784816 RepID=UPI001C500736|nr:hypothetical protein [Pseudomonas sp. D1HM]